VFSRLDTREPRHDVPSPPDDESANGSAGREARFHVVASWRSADGGAYVYTGSTLSASSAAAERWARDQMLVDHGDRGEPDVVSVMSDAEWQQAVEDVRQKIGE
jgi:hypothetical protein